MLKQIIKESPHKSFRVSKISNSIAICEANEGDRFNWGNATENEPAFLVYLGCKKNEVPGYIKTLNIFYRCDYCEARKPKYLKGFEAEIKIRGMQRYCDSHAFGLDSLLSSETAKHPTTFNIDLDFCIADIANNFIFENQEYEKLPASVIQSFMFEAVNEFLDNFSTEPQKYVSDRLLKKINEAVTEYAEYPNIA
jgi:hypothetical protein